MRPISSRPPLFFWVAPRHLGVRRLLLFILAIGASWTLAGCESDKQKAARLAQMAQMQLESGDIVSARKTIGDAIAERDDVVQYYVLQGQISLAGGNTVGAYQAFKNAIGLDPTNQDVLAAVSNLSFRVGQFDEAARYADQLLIFNAQSIPGLEVKALVALQRRQLPEARQLAAQVLAISPNEEGAQLVEARALALQGNLVESVERLNDMSRNGKPSVAVLSTQLNVYRSQHEAGPMRAVVERMIASQPDNIDFKIDYANLLYKMGAMDDARAAVVKILTSKAGKVGTASYAQAVRLWSEFDSAPLPPALLANLAEHANPAALPFVLNHFLLTGQRQTGDQIIAKLSDDNRAKLKPIIGRYALAAGRVDQARQIARETLKADPDNVDGLMLAAEVALADRNATEAIIKLQSALSNDPLNPSAYILLARSFQAKGERWRARQVMEDGLSKIPQSQYLYDYYLPWLNRTGDRNRAVSVARTLTHASPSSTRAWDRLMAECPASDVDCRQTAQAGREAARQAYQLDDPPGTLPDRGLFGRL
jgi:predicted Zn-dependent protease